MADLQTAPVGVRGTISYFFRQTFRKHTRAEYAEFMTRGIRGRQGINRKYPWMYIRVFTLFFVLFAVYLLIVRFTSNELFTPVITFIAALCFNLPFLVLLYELYPEKDLSLISVFLTMLLGGAGANIIAQILFNIFPTGNMYIGAMLTSFFEELPKMLFTIIAIVSMSKRSPLAGFIMGAAVGCGFSVVEDMGHIFMRANEVPYMNLTTIIEISVMRGFSAFCTHTLWTAAVGWAFNLSNKWLSNIAFYITLVISCALHFAWDLQFGAVAMGFIYAGCASVAAAECIAIYHLGRRKVLHGTIRRVSGESESSDYFEEDAQSLNKYNPAYWKHWGHVTLAMAAFLMSVIAVIYCSYPFREKYYSESFSSPEKFVNFMQDGHKFSPVEDRPYNAHDSANDVNRVTVDGKVTRTTQKETDPTDGYTYLYEYGATYDFVSGIDYFYPLSVSVEFTDSHGTTSVYPREELYDGKGVLYASFFRVTETVVKGYVFTDGGIEAVVYDASFVRDLTDPQYLYLFISFAVIFAASAICLASLEIKSWRVKKQCSINNAFFAE